jgi:opacity protein-like surface antigen
MKKLLTLVASASIAFSCANAAIIFDPANPLNAVNQGGFTGAYNPPNIDPFTKAFVRFNFSGLNPTPTSFTISGISLSGAGITGALSFANLNVTGNGNATTAFVNLNGSVDPLDFASSTVSFTMPGGVINDGASFSVTIRYSSVDGDQVGTSTGVDFSAQNAAPIPEPGTWAAAALLVGGAAFARWRKRKVS